VRAVIFDRDGTLIEEHPYNGDPRRVVPLPGVAPGLAMLRSRGIPIAVATNQPGVGRGFLRMDDVHAVNGRMLELLGHVDLVAICPHRGSDACGCRKPEPGMLLQVAELMHVPMRECVVVGTSGADIGAARRAGASAVLVTGHPTPELEGSPTFAERAFAGLATDFTHAISIVLQFV
jgi:histidinol-phosphate phosphatase family protein